MAGDLINTVKGVPPILDEKKPFQLQIRVGLNFGGIVEYSDWNDRRNYAGGGINYACRVMPLADPGFALVTERFVKECLNAELVANDDDAAASVIDKYFLFVQDARVKNGKRIRVYEPKWGEATDSVAANVKHKRIRDVHNAEQMIFLLLKELCDIAGGLLYGQQSTKAELRAALFSYAMGPDSSPVLVPTSYYYGSPQPSAGTRFAKGEGPFGITEVTCHCFRTPHINGKPDPNWVEEVHKKTNIAADKIQRFQRPGVLYLYVPVVSLPFTLKEGRPEVDHLEIDKIGVICIDSPRKPNLSPTQIQKRALALGSTSIHYAIGPLVRLIS
jgi:hypothetical protein